MADISKGDMQAADNLVDEEDDMHISEEEDEEADKMSLASDLDEEDLQEVLQREKELEKETSKKKKYAPIFHLVYISCCLEETKPGLTLIHRDWLFFVSRVQFTEEEGKEEDEEPESGLLVELEGKDEKKQRETNLWFSKVNDIVIYVTASLLNVSRFSESAFFVLCRAFSLRLTWKKTPRTSFSTQTGYKAAREVQEGRLVPAPRA